MFNELLKKVEGADFYMIFSLILFLVFFIVLVIHVYTTSKEHVIKMKNIPFDQTTDVEKGGKHVS